MGQARVVIQFQTWTLWSNNSRRDFKRCTNQAGHIKSNLLSFSFLTNLDYMLRHERLNLKLDGVNQATFY